MHLEWLIVNCLKNMHFGHHCLLVKDGLQPMHCEILSFEGSPVSSRFIFEINVGKRGIRHTTTMELIDKFLVRLRID